MGFMVNGSFNRYEHVEQTGLFEKKSNWTTAVDVNIICLELAKLPILIHTCVLLNELPSAIIRLLAAIFFLWPFMSIQNLTHPALNNMVSFSWRVRPIFGVTTEASA